MRHFSLYLIAFSMVPFGAGCAQTGEACPEGEVRIDEDCVPPTTKAIPLLCRNNLTGDLSRLDWELTVKTLPIESGERFAATLEGVAVVSESLLDVAQNLPPLPDGVREGNLVDLNATVHVYSGATGDDVLLATEPIPYQCFFGRTECNPANDDPSGVPGRRSNADCQPEETLNPCGRFVTVPNSNDCAPGGECERRRKTEQCERNGFCITGDMQLGLDSAFGDYTAESQGSVLFGWADEPTIIEAQPVYEDPTGPLGFRIGIGPVLVAFECTMQADESELISFPIETP
jgi:hypothetical protein